MSAQEMLELNDLVQRCKELLEWSKTGLLAGGSGGTVRAVADRLSATIGEHYALSVAETQTKDDAMREVVRLAAQSDAAGDGPVAWLYEMAFRIKPSDEQPFKEWKQVVTIEQPPTIPKDGVRDVVALYAHPATQPQRSREALEAVQYWDEHESNPASYGGLPKRIRDIVDAALSGKPGGQGGWLPIETAPRDGTRILARGGALDDIEIVSYSPNVGAWATPHYTLDDRDDEPDGYNRPRFWMPLPDTSTVSSTHSNTPTESK